jgi:hypothetical protein
MNTDKVLIVILLVVGIVALSNLAMFTLVRGSKGMKFDWFKNARGFTQPFGAGDDSLSELRERVEGLEEAEKEED